MANTEIPKKYNLSEADIRTVLVMKQYMFTKQQICDKFNIPTWVVYKIIRENKIT